MAEIRFGTDGWRGVIANDFTRENVETVARAYAVALHRRDVAEKGVVVGYDARFLSDRNAGHVARVLSEAGIPVTLAWSLTTTPAVSHAVVALDAAGGVAVTASHNPPEYNGLKFKSPYGGSAGPEEIAEIAACLGEAVPRAARAPIREADVAALYRERLIASLPPKRDGRRLRIVVDPMHGAAQGLAADLLRERGHDVIEIRGDRNPLFGGVNPEPIPPHVDALGVAVREAGADLGLAMDGDADRIGAVTAHGDFFDAHRIFALLAHTMLASGERGRLVKTVSTTTLLDRIGADFGVEVTTTPVGFKYVCAEILKGDVLMGGEESGGLWTRGAIPERDGIRMALLLADAAAQMDRSLHEAWEQLTDRYGTVEYRRRDRVVPIERREEIESVAADCRTIDGVPVRRVDRRDGVKLIREDGYWLMFRFSGTEPLLRLYAEADSADACGRFLDEAEAHVAKAIGEPPTTHG